MKKVIILGSGALKIGEAGEFDYSGSQAIKALKEEGIKTVLINPNIATIQTSEGFADQVYFLPVNAHFVEQVIKKEKPDGILLAFGGQTALNCGVDLHRKGILKRYKVKVLGTPVQSIMDTEDRDLFVRKLDEIGLKYPKSIAVTTPNQAQTAARKIGFPIMLRAAYTLGGQGSGVARDAKELSEMASKALAYTEQILIEEYLGGWKEVEYEVVRDRFDNCITVCNMENFDPLGIHTGESIVVAPSQTLTNSEYHKLRKISIEVIRHIGVIGECNIQFALDPRSEEYRIIEVNARLSRSSALASKATGYPLAFIAAKLALGYSLTELSNSITKVTRSCFEPALDYIVVKIPRWDLQKFRRVSPRIGSGMKSVGEVMSIARNFEEALQKALRMLGIGVKGLVCNGPLKADDISKVLTQPTDKRIFAIVKAIKSGMSISRIYSLSGIDPWFLSKIKRIIDIQRDLRKTSKRKVSEDLLKTAKKAGFSDEQVAYCLKTDEAMARKIRHEFGIRPVVKQIDTLAAEYPARTNYLYLTYDGEEDDIEYVDKGRKVMVLGGGAYRIGSSVEFDWCCVNAVFTLKKLGVQTIMVNHNPETVSTDYDICDKLYFDELSYEMVSEIHAKECPEGVIISMGGQVPNNLALPFEKEGIKVMGTSPKDIDRAEDRYKFSSLLDKLGIDQPLWKELSTTKSALKFAESAGYPVLVRPSYVLSGAAMNVAFNKKDLTEFLDKASDVSKEHPVVISKFILNAKEIEIDAVAKDGEVLVWAISEHIENAGVHSGDATMVLPPQKTYLETIRRIKVIARKIAKGLRITGPFNIQFIAKENQIKVIECNLRASRSFPFVSKVTKKNFIDIATRAIMDEKVNRNGINALDLDYVGVKAPQFSFSRLMGADPILSVEMSSTGEVACFGENLNEAFLKSIISAGFSLPEKKNVLISLGGEQNKHKFLGSAAKLVKMGFRIYATEHTSEFLNSHKIPNRMVYKAHNLHKKANIVKLIKDRVIDLVINIPDEITKTELEDEYIIRRMATDFHIPLFTNLQVAKLFVEASMRTSLKDLESKSWERYTIG